MPDAPRQVSKRARSARPADAWGGAARWFDRLSSWGSSLLVHGSLLMLLALARPTQRLPTRQLLVEAVWAPADQVRWELASLAVVGQEERGGLDAHVEFAPLSLEAPRRTQPSDRAAPLSTEPVSRSGAGFDAQVLGAVSVARRPRANGAYAQRSETHRARLVREHGGTPESEAVVALGLDWMVRHQQADGGWSFDHRARCDGTCSNAGTARTTTGATGLALLALLGAGETPLDGRYADAVARGLTYLRGRMRATPYGGDLQEGTMYGQALATLALCEAAAMTGDAGLRTDAQAAVDYVVYAQDPRGGGWRYFPRQPGDTTVLGWQLQALTAAESTGLEVPESTFARAEAFLASVETAGGMRFGYRPQQPEATSTTTAIGLLGCQLLGRADEATARGLRDLARQGPSSDNLYSNYVATLALFRQGGPDWNAWNAEIRDGLVRAQERNGHPAGSWYQAGGQAMAGGRLYTTALAVLTLEVYYRHQRSAAAEPAVARQGTTERR
jgi:Squalene-hopene cyclase C-terminal domain